MNNNQNKSKNLVYQYSATATPNINYDINIGNTDIKVNTLRPKTEKNRFEPALRRARRALQLVNPFKGV